MSSSTDHDTPLTIDQIDPNHLHEYRRPVAGERRSPCPGLNTLANHGYLPRSGSDLTLTQLITALQEVYHLSLPLALLLSLTGLLLCGHGIFPRRLHLDSLAAHNKIEHNASLVHTDAPPHARFAPTRVDTGLLHSLLTVYSPRGHGFGLREFAAARRARESILARPLDALHEEIACAEGAMTWLVMRDETSGEVPVESMRVWYGEERLPAGYSRPTQPVGLTETRRRVKVIKEAKANGQTEPAMMPPVRPAPTFASR
ncbi:hypothetical protein HGRIS_007083 [Hohenbuehelia grisea]|uniref:Heme haloperoxidase family profile domain-containing protein n=1 Tax=Hohenbuehelia grisea TaxID=104357 RepID=A0ABR3JAZ2_9AGAR